MENEIHDQARVFMVPQLKSLLNFAIANGSLVPDLLCSCMFCFCLFLLYFSFLPPSL